MWGLGAVIYAIGMVIATVITIVGTYYVVNWISPPITQTMPENR